MTVPQAAMMLGDCRELLSQVPDGYCDCVVTDPPYAEVGRAYGRWTEPEWHDLMEAVVAQCRRVLKPRGSAVFVLQPSCERVGRMRLWTWEFLLRTAKSWNLVQDVYWWNTTALPKTGQVRARALPRPSVKLCVWLGPEDCYRNLDAVLKDVSATVRAADLDSLEVSRPPSGWRGPAKPKFQSRPRMYRKALERGGATPFNCLPIPNSASQDSAGAFGHGAGTPAELCNWWVRYICPPGGVVLDPFLGSGTVALEALKLGRHAVGIEQYPAYFGIAEARAAALLADLDAADRAGTVRLNTGS